MNSVLQAREAMAEANAVTTSEFRAAMARLGAAVNIVTSDGPAGRVGFAATAVCSVTDAPPTLLVCLNRNASVFSAVIENGVLSVNTLAAGQEGLSAVFGGKTSSTERFAAATWSKGETGAPMLIDALVSFDCRIADCVDVGTHRVLFAEVLSVRQSAENAAMIYFDRSYHRIGGADAR